MRHTFIFVLCSCVLCVLINACGSPTAIVPTVTPVPTSTPSPTPEPSPTRAPTATVEPTAAPLLTSPVPTATAQKYQALYPCTGGFCRSTLGTTNVKQLIAASDPALHGFAFSADGMQIVLARDASSSGDAEIVLTDVDLQNAKRIGVVKGVESGAGGIEGYGVLGLAADGMRFIFEDQAQLFSAKLDGSEHRAIFDQRVYGASSTHSYMLSPSGAQVLYTSTNSPNNFEIASTTEAISHTFTLAADRRALALVDDSHVLIEQFDPPFDPQGGNPATIARFTRGYEIAPIEGDHLGEAVRLAQENGSMSRSVVSNVAGDVLLLRDEFQRNGGEESEAPVKLWLFNWKTGTRLPATLPNYDGFSRVAIGVSR